uniref:Uncharacterized protein n=1 Tax=Romanomermis culicivorax TaxID=13658 RepID=A0A915HVP2_ROMCU
MGITFTLHAETQEKKAWSQSCPPGTPVVRCKADPCSVNSCPKYPNAECRANYCGGCNADFYIKGRKGDNRKATMPTNVKLAISRKVTVVSFLAGKPLVQCFVDPCQVNKCPNYPDATCKANYCGVCTAEFYVNGRKVDCGRKQSSGSNVKPVCPRDKPLVQCFDNPCHSTKCTAHPDAVCKPDYCGGCNAVFYVNGQKYKVSHFLEVACQNELGAMLQRALTSKIQVVPFPYI